MYVYIMQIILINSDVNNLINKNNRNMIIYNKNKTDMDHNMLISLLIDFSCCT